MPRFAFTSPLGFVRPLDLHTCYTPWPVFRDVTDGAGLITTLAVTRQRLSQRVLKLPGMKRHRMAPPRAYSTDQKAARHRRIAPERAWLYYRPGCKTTLRKRGQTRNRQHAPVGDLITCCGGLRNAMLVASVDPAGQAQHVRHSRPDTP